MTMVETRAHVRSASGATVCVALCVALCVAMLAAAACSPVVDLTTAVQFESLTTGWTDVELRADGANKLVPAISFKVKNASDKTLAPLQVNAIFRRVGDAGEWSNAMITAAGS